MRLGIETIYQINSMVPTMSIARNLFIGREPLTRSHRRRRAHRPRADAAGKRAGDRRRRSPPALARRAASANCRAASGRASPSPAPCISSRSVLILDEPTNHLSVKETNKVLGFVRGLQAQGVTGIFISHNHPSRLPVLRPDRRDGARRNRVRQPRQPDLDRGSAGLSLKAGAGLALSGGRREIVTFRAHARFRIIKRRRRAWRRRPISRPTNGSFCCRPRWLRGSPYPRPIRAA